MLNIKVYVCLGLAFCVIDDIEAYHWDINLLNSVVQSHSQSLRKIHESLRRTDHVWDWFNSNKKLLSDLISETRRDKNDDVTYKSEFAKYAREIQTNFSLDLKREMSGELDRRDILREANLSKEELNLLKLDIKSVNETCANTAFKVAEYSRRNASSTNTTVENGISEISRMRLQLHDAIEYLSNGQKKIDSIENRMHNIESKLEDLLLDKFWDFKNEEEPFISNMNKIERKDFSNGFVMRQMINEIVQKNVANINVKIDILTSQLESMDTSGVVLNRTMEKGEPGAHGPQGPKGEKGNMGQGGLPGIGQKGDKGSMGPGGLPGIGQKGDKGSMVPGGLPGIGQKGDKGSMSSEGLPGIG